MRRSADDPVRTAGRGAAEQARVHADRVEDLRRRLEDAERRQHAWQAGAEGERLVAAELRTLEAQGWVVLHDVRWPGRQRANLDHVAIGPGGVVVVDAKNWSGPVSLREGVLRCGSWRKDGELEGVASATAAVAALLEPRHRTLVRGALCLVQQDVPATPTTSGVLVVGRTHLCDTLGRLPERLSGREVARLAASLRALLATPTTPAGTRRTPPRTPAPLRAPAVRRTPASAPARRPLRRRILLRLLETALGLTLGVLALAFALHLLR